MRRRVLYGLLIAITLAGPAVAVTPKPLRNNPICLFFEEGSLEWYLFLCYLDVPSKAPRT